MMQMRTMEDFEAMNKKMDRIEAMLKVFASKTCAPEVVTIQDICQIENASYCQLAYKEIYLLPRFGESGYPEGRKRWDLSEYLNWRAIPVEERKAACELHLKEQLKKDVEARKRGIKE